MRQLKSLWEKRKERKDKFEIKDSTIKRLNSCTNKQINAPTYLLYMLLI